MSDIESPRACTFLNGHGDITIEWSEKDDDKMKDLICKKMNEGYQFFIIKPRWGGLLGKKKERVRSISDIKKSEISILDKDIELFVKDAKSANLLGSQGDANYEVVRCAKDATEAVKYQTVGTKPVRGG